MIARAVMDQIVRFGEVRRGRLGITMQDLAGADGASVAEVEPRSPAAQAGLRKGDVIVALNGRAVRGAAELRARLSVVPVGERVELGIRRGGQPQLIRATVGPVQKRTR